MRLRTQPHIIRAWRLLEAALLACAIAGHWGDNNPDRLWALAWFLPIFIGRAVLLRRLFTRTPFDIPLIALGIVYLVNPLIAPHTWGAWTIARPLLGLGIVWVIGDWGRDRAVLAAAVAALVIAAGALGGLALVTQQYTIKSLAFQPVIDLLPQVRDLPFARGGFNVNEIGGVLALCAPLAAGAALSARARFSPALRAAAWGGLALLLLALLLGQSRMAIIGALTGGVVIAFGAMHSGARRSAVLAGIAALALLEGAVVTNVLLSPAQSAELAERDAGSQEGRLNIWASAISIVRDHPLTGVGINQFRARQVRAAYPVRGYEVQVLPHAHNIALHIGTDAGIPGVAAYVGVCAAFIWCVWRSWRGGDELAVIIGAAWVGWIVYSAADAITLADRFAFAWWVIVGCAAALYAGQPRRFTPRRDSAG